MSSELEIATLLHSHSERLIDISSQLEPILEYLNSDRTIFSENPNSSEIEAIVFNQAVALERAVRAACDELDTDPAARVHSEERWSEAKSNLDSLKSYIDPDNKKRARLPFLFSRVADSREIFTDREALRIGREKMREILRKADALQKTVCLLFLRESESRIVEMREQTKAVQGYYGRLIEPHIGTDLFEASKAVGIAIRQQQNHASQRGIRLESNLKLGRSMIKGDLSLVARALNNLISNAVKYNYALRDEGAWVSIKAFKDRQRIVYEVESWGTPIAKDEIASRDIFKPGRRGAFATSQGLIGYGIGLAEAELIANSHSGTIDIESVPARAKREGEAKEPPYITTARLYVPEHL